LATAFVHEDGDQAFPSGGGKVTGVDPPATASNDAAIRGSVATARLVDAVVVGELGGTKAAHPPTKRRIAVLADDLIV
jgi:hypothetical protein